MSPVPQPEPGTGLVPAPPRPRHTGPDFDWSAAEEKVADLVEPSYVAGQDTAVGQERPALRLADVAGMDAVKERIEAAFLAPLRHPELRRL